MIDPSDPILGEWRAVYGASMSVPPPGTHPSEDDWERLATDRLGDDARAALGDHVVTCAACRDTFRVVCETRTRAAVLDPAAVVAHDDDARMGSGMASMRTVNPFPTRDAHGPWPASARWAIAASVAAAVGLAAWGATMQRRATAVAETLASRQRDARPAAPTPTTPQPADASRADRSTAAVPNADVERLERELADTRTRIAGLESAMPGRLSATAAAPELDVALVDLEPVDALRSGAPSPALVSLPRGALRVALVLAVPGSVQGTMRSVEIRDGAGGLLWQGTGARVTAERTVVLIVPRALLPPGRVTVQVREPRGSSRSAVRFEAQLDYR